MGALYWYTTEEAVEPRLLRAREAAVYLGVSESTVRSWAYSKRIPSVKLGGRFAPLRFRIEDLDALIEESLVA